MTRVSARRALVIEPIAVGHYLEYAAYVIAALKARQYEVVVATSEEGKRRLVEEFGVEPSTEFVQLSQEGSTDVKRCVALARYHDCTWVLVPSGDQFAYRIARSLWWPRDIALTVLLLRSPVLSPRVWWRDSLKRIALWVTQQRFGVTVLHLAGPGAVPRNNLRVVHDISRWQRTDDSVAHLDVLLESGRFWYAILGLLDTRKNIASVMRALTGPASPQYGLLLAGPTNSKALEECYEAWAKFEEAGGSVVLLGRRLEEYELDYLVDAVNCVVCAHATEGPSGIMLKAMAAGQRVVAAGALSLQRDAKAFEGCVWSQLSSVDLAAGLAQATLVPRPRRQPFGSPESFGGEFLDTKVLESDGGRTVGGSWRLDR